VTGGSNGGGVPAHAADLRRWLALGFVLFAVAVPVIDNTVLTVAIPRIIDDLDTDVTSVQWVFTGYALTFASVLVIGGRLGDMFGPRRILVVGASLFGLGSLIAAVSTSLPMLIGGEAVIEGVGAALMVPNTMSLIARTFQGRQRIAAFAAYATVLGAASSIGPVIGGYLTTYHSWRWSFGINVFIAPIVIAGLLFTTDRDSAGGDRQRLDIRGAVLIASGTFLVVFGLTQGPSYGWWRPTDPLTIAGQDIWPVSAPISIVPVAFLAGVGLIVLFCRTEISLERRDAHPLFEFSQFRFRTFRLANIATFCMAFAQLGVALSISLFLQESKDLTPMQNGLWVLPTGLAIFVGAPAGGWVSRRIGAITTMRIGATVNVVGLFLVASVLSSDLGYGYVLPTFVVYGFGAGMVSSQITRVLLHDIAPARSGAASGINTTARQTATALGVATIGTIFATVADSRGFHAALWPAMLAASVALIASAAVMWRLPQIDDEAHILDRGRVADRHHDISVATTVEA